MKVFTNAEFISCEEDNRLFSTLIAENGTIVHTGNDIPEKYASAETVDLKGKCVVPAFGDTHIHFQSFSFIYSGLDCRGASDFKELESLILNYIEENPKKKIIVGFGSSAHTVQEKRLPDRKLLDKITDKPVMIVKYDGHAAIGNTALINRLPSEITRVPGFDSKTGGFYQEAFYKAVDRVSKSVPLFDVIKNMQDGADYLANKGIALVHTADGVGFPLDLDIDLMRLGAYGMPQEFRLFFQTMDIKKVRKRKLPRIGGCFDTALDGCFGSEDAALLAPYANNPENRGTLVYTQDEVNNFVLQAHEAGLQVSLHAIGDAAVEQAITAFEYALCRHPRNDHRHIIIHACLINRQQIKRAADLGLCMALQTPFLDWKAEPREYLDTILGDRAKWLTPLKTMQDAGIVMANGSDGPCTLPDPIFGIHTSCNHPDPSESIEVMDALRMHTVNAAKLSFDEKRRGTLAEGMAADFAVLDRNPLNIPKEELKNIRIEALFLKGDKYREKKRSATGFIFKSIMEKVKK